MSNPKILQNTRVIQKCIVVNGDGKILALRRTPDDRSRPSCWDLPGGGYEHGEEVVEAVKREVKEEAGLTVLDIFPFFVSSRVGEKSGLYQGEDTVFALCYVSSRWEGEVMLSDEHSDYRWVTPQEFAGFDFGVDGGFFQDAAKAYISLPHSY